jgi:hypothetical protein
MVRIQYASDLHINDYPKGTPFESFVTPVSPILVLAGDVCSAWDPLYRAFLAWCSRNWYLVIVVSGNHEYYCEPGKPHSMIETDAHMYDIAGRFQNVVYLQNGASYVVPNTRIRFVGATLWSAIDPAIWDEIAGKKGDYKATYTAYPTVFRKTHPSDICALHALHKMFLVSALAPQIPGEILVVVTHHMPTLHLLEDHYKGERWHSCYASNDDDLLLPNVRAWICGHSHRAVRWRAPYGGPLCLMNARGYNRPNELGRHVDIYNPQAVINI